MPSTRQARITELTFMPRASAASVCFMWKHAQQQLLVEGHHPPRCPSPLLGGPARAGAQRRSATDSSLKKTPPTYFFPKKIGVTLGLGHSEPCGARSEFFARVLSPGSTLAALQCGDRFPPRVPKKLWQKPPKIAFSLKMS